jgi:hypothetical protein
MAGNFLLLIFLQVTTMQNFGTLQTGGQTLDLDWEDASVAVNLPSKFSGFQCLVFLTSSGTATTLTIKSMFKEVKTVQIWCFKRLFCQNKSNSQSIVNDTRVHCSTFVCFKNLWFIDTSRKLNEAIDVWKYLNKTVWGVQRESNL